MNTLSFGIALSLIPLRAKKLSVVPRVDFGRFEVPHNPFWAGALTVPHAGVRDVLPGLAVDRQDRGEQRVFRPQEGRLALSASLPGR